MRGLTMATAHPATPGTSAGDGLSAFIGAAAAPIGAGASRLRHAIFEASASLIEDVEDMFDPTAQPVTFSSGEAAIAVGWSYIDDLESSVSSVNAALDAVNSKSVDMARAHFGNSIASRVRLLNETTLDAARYMLEHRVSSISRAFAISGKVIEMDEGGNLRMGQFTLTHDGDGFTAGVGTDQQAWIIENGAKRPISVQEVTAGLAAGRLSP